MNINLFLPQYTTQHQLIKFARYSMLKDHPESKLWSENELYEIFLKSGGLKNEWAGFLSELSNNIYQSTEPAKKIPLLKIYTDEKYFFTDKNTLARIATTSLNERLCIEDVVDILKQIFKKAESALPQNVSINNIGIGGSFGKFLFNYLNSPQKTDLINIDFGDLDLGISFKINNIIIGEEKVNSEAEYLKLKKHLNSKPINSLLNILAIYDKKSEKYLQYSKPVLLEVGDVIFNRGVNTYFVTTPDKLLNLINTIIKKPHQKPNHI